MWTFVCLYILGANIYQAAAEGNSTQMHYATIIIDESALHFLPNSSAFDFTDMKIEDLKDTTECKNKTAVKECECRSGYEWSEEVLQEKSCSNGICTFQKNSSYTCVSKTSVSITGSITLEGGNFTNCLKDKASAEYKACHDPLWRKMKEQFSILKGFDTLTITAFRVGSVIVDFEMTIANSIKTDDLIDNSKMLAKALEADFELAKALEADFELETAGIVVITVPSESVPYNEKAEIKCTSEENLGSEPDWYLKREEQDFKITNGRNTKLETLDPKSSKVNIWSVNELWEGEYRCEFVQKSGSTIIYHKAHGVMDVCLQPKIEAFTEPGFPHCQKTTDILIVKVKCQIHKSSERYNVTWSKDVSGGTQPDGDDMQTYTAEKIVSCDKPENSGSVTCIFENECMQSKNQTVDINIINVGDKFCGEDGYWGKTKAGYTAERKCIGKAGRTQRKCDPDGEWQKEQSSCVSVHLQNVLESAIIADIGLGEVEENVANIFSRFENVTETEDLNNTASLNASVQVLDTLKEKINITIQNETTIRDMLSSSSHLLNTSLEKSWAATTFEDNATVLAEKYLISIEELIEKANITNKTTRTNVEVDTCANEMCETSVFKVNVTLTDSGKGRVKTTGFKNLEGYFPQNKSEENEPNSIVVSTTKEDKSDDVQIEINFPLLKPRPRNVKLLCVSWNNKSNSWISDGCLWKGPSNEGLCVCNHLSSFSILMSKHPVEVPALTHITYVGLSISVISLVFCLFIEMVVWNDVVKTNTLYLRHTAHVNISLCLLVANCCFLASPEPKKTPPIWCKTFAVVKHFCYLSMFFWMLCLSTTLLHQAVFLFHKVSKKSYLRFSIIVGYVCPLLIVFITFLATEAGGTGSYYSKDSCWLVYSGLFQGTIYTFIIPMGIIVFINTFSMLVVIMKLLDHHQNAEMSAEKEKAAAKTVVRSVIFLTPVFGVTWGFGFAVLAMDLTEGIAAFAVNYLFTLLNAFQGFFILLTVCVADQRTREALLNHLRKKAPASIKDSTTKSETTMWKK